MADTNNDWDDLFNLIGNDCDRSDIDVNIATLIWTMGYFTYRKGEITLEQLRKNIKNYLKLFKSS